MKGFATTSLGERLFNEGFTKKGDFRLKCTIFNRKGCPCHSKELLNFRLMESPAPGILLIADPFLKDPNFMRTVVFLCEHQEEGSFGFVLNRSYDYSLDELVSGLDDLNKIPVYLGGPVQMDTIHFLHQYPDKIHGGYEIIDGVFWGGNFEPAIELIRSGVVDMAKIRFYMVYPGWASGMIAELPTAMCC